MSSGISLDLLTDVSQPCQFALFSFIKVQAECGQIGTASIPDMTKCFCQNWDYETLNAYCSNDAKANWSKISQEFKTIIKQNCIEAKLQVPVHTVQLVPKNVTQWISDAFGPDAVKSVSQGEGNLSQPIATQAVQTAGILISTTKGLQTVTKSPSVVSAALASSTTKGSAVGIQFGVAAATLFCLILL